MWVAMMEVILPHLGGEVWRLCYNHNVINYRYSLGVIPTIIARSGFIQSRQQPR